VLWVWRMRWVVMCLCYGYDGCNEWSCVCVMGMTDAMSGHEHKHMTTHCIRHTHNTNTWPLIASVIPITQTHDHSSHMSGHVFVLWVWRMQWVVMCLCYGYDGCNEWSCVCVMGMTDMTTHCIRHTHNTNTWPLIASVIPIAQTHDHSSHPSYP
jgi:hypothetical protein